ncbi:MAG: mitochondrial fission ELM1 family protein [Thermovirgaceae bacterium]
MGTGRDGVFYKKGQSNGPATVFVLSDGIRGHENQSMGIASWLEDFGTAVEVFRIPSLSGYHRLKNLKVTSRRLVHKKSLRCMKWLETSGGEVLLEEIQGSLQRSGIDGKEALFLSAGSSAAPYCLAVSGATGGRSCTVMTPSVLGTKPFDFAVVPEHDRPEASENVLVTLGAPNRIRTELLNGKKEELMRRFPPLRQNRWAFLVGGDDRNYHIGPEWTKRVIQKILAAAEKAGADLYVTTSRRTLRETERALEEEVHGDDTVRMLLLASEDDWNPVPGMLGLCDRIFCTEDSVSMVSEAATAGRRPVVLRAERKKSPATVAAAATSLFAEKGFFDEKWIFGAPRFDKMIRSFEERGLCRYLAEAEEVAENFRDEESRLPEDFNEARRAAEWILARWNP